MKIKSKWLIASLLIVALAQLSCDTTEFYDDRSERDRDRDNCEERGGIWHDIDSWCEMPADKPQPTATNPLPTATFDIAQCDARDEVEVVIVLNDDYNSTGGRNCWYTLTVTNHSDHTVAFYVWENRDDHEHHMQSRWWFSYIYPGQTADWKGHYTNWTSGEWSYCYLERAAAVYYNDYCGYRGLGIDYNDEEGTSERFAWDLAPILCEP